MNSTSPSGGTAAQRRTLPSSGPYQAPAWTTEERLQRIEAMGDRISACIKFMCQVDKRSGASAEAREKAIAAFYEQLVIVERDLARIQYEFTLV